MLQDGIIHFYSTNWEIRRQNLLKDKRAFDIGATQNMQFHQETVQWYAEIS